MRNDLKELLTQSRKSMKKLMPEAINPKTHTETIELIDKIMDERFNDYIYNSKEYAELILDIAILKVLER